MATTWLLNRIFYCYNRCKNVWRWIKKKYFLNGIIQTKWINETSFWWENQISPSCLTSSLWTNQPKTVDMSELTFGVNRVCVIHSFLLFWRSEQALLYFWISAFWSLQKCFNFKEGVTEANVQICKNDVCICVFFFSF